MEIQEKDSEKESEGQLPQFAARLNASPDSDSDSHYSFTVEERPALRGFASRLQWAESSAKRMSVNEVFFYWKDLVSLE